MADTRIDPVALLTPADNVAVMDAIIALPWEPDVPEVLVAARDFLAHCDEWPLCENCWRKPASKSSDGWPFIFCDSCRNNTQSRARKAVQRVALRLRFLAGCVKA